MIMGAFSIWHLLLLAGVSLLPLFVLYWVIRLAVLHALRDHDRTQPKP